MEVIQYPERIDPGCLANLTLLPIHPPEIHALILERVVHSLEVSIKELSVGRVKYYGLQESARIHYERKPSLPLCPLDPGLEPCTCVRSSLRRT
jgi:hypothetical protein